MATRKPKAANRKNEGATVGYEAQLWQMADCDHRTPPPADAGYPYVAIPQLRSGRIDLSGVRRISRAHYLEWTRKAKPQVQDVILSRRCNPGETAVAPADLAFAVGQNLVLLRADGTRIHSPFLRWLVRGPEWWGQISKFINVGAVFDSLKCTDVPNFELRIPPHRRMSETLEAMARALFKSWLVDFDPVRAKSEGRDSGLPKPLTDLFPARFVDSELGEIPEGWEVSRCPKSSKSIRHGHSGRATWPHTSTWRTCRRVVTHRTRWSSGHLVLRCAF